MNRNKAFTPRLAVSEDGLYVVHDDGYIRKWTLIGELEESFSPIPVGGTEENKV